MLYTFLGILLRIFSNSYLNVFQKILTNRGKFPSVINFYTYAGLVIIGYLACSKPVFNYEILPNIIIMGFLGAFGNYLIIKALSCGELSTLAPINSYKPVIALIFGFFILNETPGLYELIGIILIITGTFILANSKILYSKATIYRFLALIFSGTEAIFIKKVILLSDIPSAFLYWALSGLVFSIIFVFISKHFPQITESDIKYQIALIAMTAIMQYSTNYVFTKMNVAYALALFQLSTIISVFLGINIFKEEGLLRKLSASFIMLTGAVILILR